MKHDFVLTFPAALAVLCVLVLVSGAVAGDAWVTYPGGGGPGAGTSIVLVSGDEEYRSEEALPQLAKILAVRHGFTCRVLFAIDPATGEIDPDNRRNIPGLAALDDADLMIIATRFRDLPDEQMAHIDAYVESGKPIIGLRTATHAFAIESSDTYRKYSWNNEDAAYEQGFGRQVLGETWIAHHGEHGRQSTRGIAALGAEGHVILRGITPGSIWGPTDVYRVRLPLPEGCTPIVLGAVLDGMEIDDPPVVGEPNDPMMPIAWTKTGAAPGARRVFTTTMGAATDLAAEGTRRMLVNGVYWALDMGDRVPARGSDVRLVGPYDPTGYGFGGSQRGVLPHDHALPAPGGDARRGGIDRDGGLALDPGGRILVVGNTFAERLAQSGLFDAVTYAAHPGHDLVIRHVPWSADEVAIRPREHSVPLMEEWETRLDPDVVFCFFGMSESLAPDMDPERFEQDLRRVVAALRLRTGADGRPPRLVLVSPIAHEIVPGFGPGLGDVLAHNARIELITAIMRGVADDEGVPFVDLYAFSGDAYRAHAEPLTTNGIHPTEAGCAVFMGDIARQLGWMDDSPAPPVTASTAERVDALRALACDTHYYERLRYRPTNTEYVWGRRHEPFGVVNFPPEMAQLERMIAAREAAMSAMDLPPPAAVVARATTAPPQWPNTPTTRAFPEDAWTPVAVEAKGTETSLGSVEIADPDAFLESFTLPAGYVIECFASEREFPELQSPLAMTFDDRGRLWVLCTPTYPHLLPGERARCILLILEDTDRDGRADASRVFADGLYVPMGFAVDGNAVYVGQAPDLLRLVDTDGDDRADVREIVYSGFGMPDSHHQMSAFEWDPSGAFVFHEGVFTKSNVETPSGTRRTTDAAVWRFDPRTERLTVLSHCGFSNPWGHVFDDFGQSILADASGGDNHVVTHITVPFAYPRKPDKPARFLNRGRPTAGCELIASRHFPPDVQGSFLVNQSIGFHGTRWDRVRPEGSTLVAESMPQDLVACSDVNFRPVAMEIGPDGALYIVDWCNPIIGHMQYSVRDPRRDNSHGRIWRVRHRDRPLVVAPDIHDATINELLEHLRLPERNTRQLARRRLQRADWETLSSVLNLWTAALDPADPLYARLTVEDLWIRHAHGHVTPERLERVLALDEPRARAAGTRVIRHLVEAGDLSPRDARPLLARAIDDADMRVRLEAVVACGFLPAADGIDLAARADLAEMDDAMNVVFGEVISYLGRGGDVTSDVLERVKLERMPAAELLEQPLTDLSAAARLVRPDLPRAARRAALVHLAGADGAAQSARLLALAGSVRGDESVRAVGDLLMAMPEAALDRRKGDARTLAASDDPARRAVGVGVLLRTGDGAALAAPPDAIVDAVALMDAGAAPEPALVRIRGAVDAHEVDAMRGIRETMRHERDRDAVRPWLAGLVAAAETTGLDRWGPGQERAMAALRGLNETASPEDWETSGQERYRIEPASASRMAAGEAVFHDEAVGCVRCHGPNGRGLEGFPPLDRSPWVLGNPARAASIVVHGLFGGLRLHDGRAFDSSMEPLGETLDDQQIADALTYVRQSWGNFAPPVTAEMVAAARAAGPEAGQWETTAILAAYPLRTDSLVPRPETPRRPLLVEVARQFVIYLAPPLAMFALIVLLLERSSRRK